MTNFEKVSDWIFNEKEVEVRVGQVTCYMGHVMKRIFVHHNYNFEKNGLFALLHECGHALQPKAGEGVNEFIRMKVGTKKWFEARLANETDAWESGERIAKELKLDMDWKAFFKLKEEALDTYRNF